jgi:hypothetical protein
MQAVILDPGLYCVLNGHCSGPNERSSRVLERKVNRGLSFFPKKDFFKISSRSSWNGSCALHGCMQSYISIAPYSTRWGLLSDVFDAGYAITQSLTLDRKSAVPAQLLLPLPRRRPHIRKNRVKGLVWIVDTDGSGRSGPVRRDAWR